MKLTHFLLKNLKSSAAKNTTKNLFFKKNSYLFSEDKK
jgi:hypothetical protein